MNISDAGLDLIRRYESLRLEAYLDTGGVWTIGYGHTLGVREGDTCSRETAEAWLRVDVLQAEAEVEKWVEVELGQPMYDAVVSFEFNTGGLMIGRPARPSRFLAALNNEQWCDAVEELVHWNMDNGRPLRGLLRRRLEEGLLFASEPWPA